MISVDRARKIVLNSIPAAGKSEVAGLRSSLGRIIAADITAADDIPPFDNSAMDGFAIRSLDSRGASSQNPRTFEVIEDLPAGAASRKTVGPGQAIRIMTGAPMPRGADSVVMVEETSPGASDDRKEHVKILKEVKSGENIRGAGEDIRKGDIAIKKGSRLGPAHLGMLASLGYSRTRVFRAPKVAILATGDELIGVSENLRPGKIRNSNTYSLYGLAASCGAIPVILGVARDSKSVLERKIREGLKKADMLLVSGGVSVGDYDFVKDVLRDLGADMKFWKVAMRPGKPLAFGMVGNVPVFGLPGNPVSSMVSFELFVRPAILKMLGRTEDDRKDAEAFLEEEVEKKPGLRYFLRAKTAWRDGAFFTRTTGPQGSGILKSMALANSVIILPERVEKVRKGEKARVRFLN